MFIPSPNAFGGTEYMIEKVNKLIQGMPKFKNYLTYCLPGGLPENYIENLDKPTILYLHNPPSQLNNIATQLLVKTKSISGNNKYYVVPSQRTKNDLLQFGIDDSKVFVIPNAITPLNPNPNKWKKSKKVEAVYISNATRGLENVLNVFDKLDKDINLTIFTNWQVEPTYRGVFNIHDYMDYTTHPRITWYGFSPKATVQRYLEEKAQLLLYPAQFMETFCLSMVEAMSAGAMVCTSNTGALKETGGEYIRTFDWSETMQYGVDNNFADVIGNYKVFNSSQYYADLEGFVSIANEGAQEIKDGKFDPTEQMQFVNKTYSWDKVKKLWEKFHDSLPDNP